MPRKLTRLALLTAICGFAVIATSFARAKPDRRGKVVRVERPRIGASESLRACLYTQMNTQKFTCFGVVPPEIGDRFTVADENGYRGKARATKVSIGEYDTCKLGVSYDIEFAYEDKAASASAKSVSSWGNGLAIRGAEVDPTTIKVLTDHSRIRSPSGKDHQVWMAMDLTGDGDADLISTWYDGCDRSSNRPTPPANKTLKPLCLDYWLKTSGEWKRKTTDSYYLCM